MRLDKSSFPTLKRVHAIACLLLVLLPLLFSSMCFALSLEFVDPEKSAQAELIRSAKRKYEKKDLKSALKLCDQALRCDEYQYKEVESYALRAEIFEALSNIEEANKSASDCFYRAAICGQSELAPHYLTDPKLCVHQPSNRRFNNEDFSMICKAIENYKDLPNPPKRNDVVSLLKQTNREGLVSWQNQPLWNSHRWDSFATGKPKSLTLAINPERCTITYEDVSGRFDGSLKELHGTLRDPPFAQQYQLESPNCMVVLHFTRTGARYLQCVWFFWNAQSSETRSKTRG